jgi:hypothetical protein
MVNQKNSRVVDVMIFTLVAIYVGSYFLPGHWGVKCDADAPPLGSVALGLFYIVWTFYSVNTIRNDPMLKLKEQSWKDLINVTKQLSLKEFDGEFNHEGMILA